MQPIDKHPIDQAAQATIERRLISESGEARRKRLRAERQMAQLAAPVVELPDDDPREAEIERLRERVAELEKENEYLTGELYISQAHYDRRRGD